MSQFDPISVQCANDFFDASSSEALLAGLTDLDVFNALGVPSELSRYVTPRPRHLPLITEAQAVMELRDLRTRPRACVRGLLPLLDLVQTGHQALHFAVNDPWLRFALGMGYLYLARDFTSQMRDELSDFDMSESDELALAYMRTNTSCPWALYMAAAWVLTRSDLTGLWEAALWPQTSAAMETTGMIFSTAEWAIHTCTAAWAEHVQTSYYVGHYGDQSRVRDPILVATCDEDAATSWCAQILGRRVDRPDGRWMDVGLRQFDLLLPGGRDRIWTHRYVTWVSLMAEATVSLVQGKPEAYDGLPCVLGSDPVATAAVAYGKRMLEVYDAGVSKVR